MIVQDKNVIREITPLSEKDCFYIADRRKSEFTYPMHCHKEFELNFVINAPGVQRIVGDSAEVIGDWCLSPAPTWSTYGNKTRVRARMCAKSPSNSRPSL